MNIKQKKENKKLTVFIEGNIDTTTSPVLMEFLTKEMRDINELVLDFEKVEYVSSAGLRVLLFAQKTMNDLGEMVICNVNDDIMEVLELTCFTDILNIR